MSIGIDTAGIKPMIIAAMVLFIAYVVIKPMFER